MKKILKASHPSSQVTARNPWLWLYITLFITWVAFCFTLAAFFVSFSLKEAESRFNQYCNAYAEHLYDKVSSNQIVLEGFAALFGAFGTTDSRDVSHYARQVIANHPHIYSLEIVQTVPSKELNQFGLQQRKAGFAHFQIKTFGYDTDQKWHATTGKAIYYPVVFMEPMRPASAEVLGLDVGSVPFLRPAIVKSITTQSSVATRPFQMVEGGLAYVIFLPVHSRINSATQNTMQPAYTVDMVVDAAKMAVPDSMPLSENLHLVVYHADYLPEDSAGQIVHIHQPPTSSLEQLLFPGFSFQREIGPYLNMLVEKQTGWSDINLSLLAMILLATLLSSAILLGLIRSHYRSSLAELESKKNLWFLANHDVLTLLPNRNLFMDRIGQAIARSQRQGTNFGILFLDLNGFKQINDTYGHDAGDQLLQLAAQRLQTCIRADDSVARLGGDEFVVLLEGITDAEVMESIVQKIRASMALPFTINKHQLLISASIGKATFPMQGKTPDDLLRFADAKMYAEKFPQRTRVL
jgi:diguanylate cyclase (GGDEF)-like protein